MSDPLSYTVRVVHFRYTPQAFQALMRYARRHHVNREGRYLPSDQQIDIWSHPWDVRGSRRLVQLRFLLIPSRPPELQSLVCEHATGAELLIELGCLEIEALGVVQHGTVPPEPPHDL